MSRAGFTGTQKKTTPEQLKALVELLLDLDPTHCHHGDCIGADSLFHAASVVFGGIAVIHPPLNSKKRMFSERLWNRPDKTEVREPKEYLDRNKDIVNETDYLIAMPFTEAEELRSGTWSTVRYARKLKKKIYIINPDGTIKEEN